MHLVHLQFEFTRTSGTSINLKSHSHENHTGASLKNTSLSTDDSLLQYLIRNKIFLVFILSLLVGSFLLRWNYVQGTEMIMPIRGDASLYTQIACNLVEHGVYSTDVGPDIKPTPQSRDPGYPFFLAAIIKLSGLDVYFFLKTCWVQSLLGAITVVLSYFLARFVLPPLWSASVSILAMFSPHLISISNHLLTETLFIFLLMLGVVTLLSALKREKPWLLASAGLILGLAMSVKFVFALYPIAIAALFLLLFKWQREVAVRHAVIILLTAFVFIIPWKAWEYLTISGVPESPSLFKQVLMVGTYKGLIYDGVPVEQQTAGGRKPYDNDPNFNAIVNAGYGAIFNEIGRRFGKDPVGYSSWLLLGKPAMFFRWRTEYGGYNRVADINEYPSTYTWYDNNKLMTLTKNAMEFLHPLIIVLMFLGVVMYLFQVAFITSRRGQANSEVAGSGVRRGIAQRIRQRYCFAGDLELLQRPKFSNNQNAAMCIILSLIGYFLVIHVILVPAPRYSLPIRPFVYFMAVYAIFALTAFLRKTSSQEPTE